MCARNASVSFAICQVELNWTVTPTTDAWHSAANVELTSFLTNQGIDTNKWLHRLWLTLRDLPSTKSQHFMSPVFNPLLLLSSFTELAFMGPNRSLDQVADAQSLCAVELAAPIHMESQCRSAVVSSDSTALLLPKGLPTYVPAARCALTLAGSCLLSTNLLPFRHALFGLSRDAPGGS